MNGLLLSNPNENKDIKFNTKNIKNLDDTKVEEKDDFFQNLIQNLLQKSSKQENKNFLIGKLFQLPQKFDKNEEILSNLSKKDEISVESLLEIASFLQNSPKEVLDFPTESKSLKTSLLDLNVQNEFKNAKSLKDLLNIAQKNGIKVKNIEFFKEETNLNPKSKNFTKIINSEEFFKTIDNQLKKSPNTKSFEENHNKNTKSNILQNLLTSQPKQKSTQTINLKENKKLIKDTPLESKIFDNKIKLEENSIKKQTKNNTNSIKTVEHDPKNYLNNKEEVINSNKTQNSKSIKISNNQENMISKNNASTIKTEDNKTKTLKTEPKTENDFKVSLNNKEEVINSNKTQNSKSIKISNNQENLISKNNTSTIKTKGNKTIQSENAKQLDIPTKASENMLKNEDIFSQKTNTIKNQQTLSSIYNVVNNKQAQQNDSLKQTNKKEKKVQTQDLSPLPKKDEQTIQNPQKVSKLSQLLQQSQQKESDNSIQNKETKKEFSAQLDTTTKKLETDENNSTNHHVNELKTTTNHVDKVDQNKELKKTFHNFAQDFKEKVESYKAPLMKIKMQLTPGNLGDVDVTLINRGNNLHVSINSNPNTIALFVQNQAEFKNSLVNMGFSGLQMNFGENKDGGQKGHNHKNSNKNNQIVEEDNHEIDNFEMIVPRYI